MAARMRTPLLSLALLAAALSTGAAAPLPDAPTIVGKMKAALEPPKSSVRQMDLSISGEDGGTTKWTFAQARKSVDGQPRMLTVLMAPADTRGIASLLIDRAGGKPPVMAEYIPMVRRVRTLTPAGAYQAVLGSDFTYADLGFISLKDKYKMLGAEKHNGKDSYKLEQTPENPWHYSKVILWVDPATMLPIERDYYDPAGQLWKIETFEDVTVIDGTPVAMRVKMQDKQSGGGSEIVVSKLRFGVDLPDDLFKKPGLVTAGNAPIWSTLQ
jgi:hypothetical protein